MRPIILIPARMAASRLPDKPLADIGGMAMIVRVLRRAEAAGVGPVAVAAGDPEIVAAVEAAGGRAVLTDPSLPSGSDRVLAALNTLDPDGLHDVAINLQGDIPFFDPSLVRACADVLAREPACDISTLVVAETGPEQRTDPDTPKAIVALAPGPAGRCISLAPPSMATSQCGDISACMAIAARRSSASAPRRPRRWKSARSWNNCGRWKWAFRSGPRWSMPRRSRSTTPPTSPWRGLMRSRTHDG